MCNWSLASCWPGVRRAMFGLTACSVGSSSSPTWTSPITEPLASIARLCRGGVGSQSRRPSMTLSCAGIPSSLKGDSPCPSHIAGYDPSHVAGYDPSHIAGYDPSHIAGYGAVSPCPKFGLRPCKATSRALTAAEQQAANCTGGARQALTKTDSGRWKSPLCAECPQPVRELAGASCMQHISLGELYRLAVRDRVDKLESGQWDNRKGMGRGGGKNGGGGGGGGGVMHLG